MADYFCPECGQSTITTQMTQRSIKHGSNSLNIPVVVPMRVCISCDFEYYDMEGSRAIDQAIADFFGTESVFVKSK